jgi:saccharopine dehydrogenase-like NADP-dependent oxidoreductase
MDSTMMKRLKWLGIFDNIKIGVPGLTPAKVLETILEKKWSLETTDKDMIIMQHQFDYMQDEIRKKIYSTMVYIGKDSYNTAMAATVGLPVAIISRMILEGAVLLKGVQIPVNQEIYEPVLKELEQYDIKFIEEEATIPRDIDSL